MTEGNDEHIRYPHRESRLPRRPRRLADPPVVQELHGGELNYALMTIQGNGFSDPFDNDIAYDWALDRG